MNSNEHRGMKRETNLSVMSSVGFSPVRTADVMRKLAYRFLSFMAALQICGIFSHGEVLFAQERRENLEYAVKAACIANFLGFIEFQSYSSVGLKIYIVGTDNFGGLMEEALSRKKTAVSVVRLAGVEELRGLDLSSQIIFITKSMYSSIPDILRMTAEVSCLTIGETPHFCEQGGIIGLRIDNNKIRFDINQEAAKKADIKISSQVLKLADIVKTSTDWTR